MVESILHKSVNLERFLVNSESFKIKLNYEFMDDNGQSYNKYINLQIAYIVLINVYFLCRQNDCAEKVNIAYDRHHSANGEATDYDVPQKKYRNIRFKKETHPLSLMVHSILWYTHHQ